MDADPTLASSQPCRLPILWSVSKGGDQGEELPDSFPPPPSSEPAPPPGKAGASAFRTHQRRKANRERRLRERYPRIGRLILALSDAPSHESSWAKGARGEVEVARSLEQRCGDRVLFLHDRRIPGSRANIDHIAIAPSGVWVIDAKDYKGKARVERPLRAKPRLMINGWNQTKLAYGLNRQVRVVRSVLDELDPNVPVHGALCFVSASLPLVRTLRVHGYPLLYRKRLAKRLNADGPVARERAELLAERLAAGLPPA